MRAEPSRLIGVVSSRSRFARNAAVAALAAAMTLGSAARAQDGTEFLGRGAPALPVPAAPAAPPTTPMSIAPSAPEVRSVPLPSAARTRPPAVAVPVPTGNPIEDDEDGDVVFEHDTPKRVTIVLPQPRPGGTPATAAEVAPIGDARWSNADDQLPPGAEVPGLEQAEPAPPRLAALPAARPGPSWTITDAPQLRPPGLRQSEAPVAAMPGVYAPPDATFDCLPDGLKQVLLDTAREFGHVAVLNARRPRGTGARASYHYQCRAVDFRVRGVPIPTVYAYLRQHPNVGGRKIYPFGFFHVDDGPARSW